MAYDEKQRENYTKTCKQAHAASEDNPPSQDRLTGLKSSTFWKSSTIMTDKYRMVPSVMIWCLGQACDPWWVTSPLELMSTSVKGFLCLRCLLPVYPFPLAWMQGGVFSKQIMMGSGSSMLAQTHLILINLFTIAEIRMTGYLSRCMELDMELLECASSTSGDSVLLHRWLVDPLGTQWQALLQRKLARGRQQGKDAAIPVSSRPSLLWDLQCHVLVNNLLHA